MTNDKNEGAGKAGDGNFEDLRDRLDAERISHETAIAEYLVEIERLRVENEKLRARIAKIRDAWAIITANQCWTRQDCIEYKDVKEYNIGKGWTAILTIFDEV